MLTFKMVKSARFVLLFLCSFVVGGRAEVDFRSEPVAVLKRNKLVGYYTFDEGFGNLADEEFDASLVLDFGSQRSSIARRGLSRYLDGKSFFEIPLPVDARVFPTVSVGAWIRPTSAEAMTSQPRCVP
jgi:hypothetical protein